MAVYAQVPAYADRGRHPRALVIILAGHLAVLAAVMTAKMDMPTPWDPTITKVKLDPEPTVPPPEPPPPQPQREPQESRVDRVPALVPVPQPELPALDPTPLPMPNPGPFVGSGTEPRIDPLPKPAQVRVGPRFATPESRVKPPYPQQKLRSEEEAALRLRLTIDARGRVTAVEPVAAADPAFLAAARRHIIAHWRYQPATEDGRAVASSTVVTLRFQLD